MGQKYVVRCTKRISRDDAGLGNGGHYRKGDFVTYDGKPARMLEKAFVYGVDDVVGEFPYDKLGNGIDLAEHFESVRVKLVTVLDE